MRWLLHFQLIQAMVTCSLNTATGIVSGTPGILATAGTTSTHTITINNAVTGGPAGSFAMNIVANAPFFTYNATGKGDTFNNIYILYKIRMLILQMVLILVIQMQN